MLSDNQVDEQLKKLDGMDRDELEEMELVRARRLEQMKAARAKRQQGHGEYREIGGSGNEKEFFEAAKQSDKMVCHFYRTSTERCAVRRCGVNTMLDRLFRCYGMCTRISLCRGLPCGTCARTLIPSSTIQTHAVSLHITYRRDSCPSVAGSL